MIRILHINGIIKIICGFCQQFANIQKQIKYDNKIWNLKFEYSLLYYQLEQRDNSIIDNFKEEILFKMKCPKKQLIVEKFELIMERYLRRKVKQRYKINGCITSVNSSYYYELLSYIRNGSFLTYMRDTYLMKDGSEIPYDYNLNYTNINYNMSFDSLNRYHIIQMDNYYQNTNINYNMSFDSPKIYHIIQMDNYYQDTNNSQKFIIPKIKKSKFPKNKSNETFLKVSMKNSNSRKIKFR